MFASPTPVLGSRHLVQVDPLRSLQTVDDSFAEHREDSGRPVYGGREIVIDLDLLELRLVAGDIPIVVLQPFLVVAHESGHEHGHQNDADHSPHRELECHQVQQEFLPGDLPGHTRHSAGQVPQRSADVPATHRQSHHGPKRPRNQAGRHEDPGQAKPLTACLLRRRRGHRNGIDSCGWLVIHAAGNRHRICARVQSLGLAVAQRTRKDANLIDLADEVLVQASVPVVPDGPDICVLPGGAGEIVLAGKVARSIQRAIHIDAQRPAFSCPDDMVPGSIIHGGSAGCLYLHPVIIRGQGNPARIHFVYSQRVPYPADFVRPIGEDGSFAGAFYARLRRLYPGGYGPVARAEIQRVLFPAVHATGAVETECLPGLTGGIGQIPNCGPSDGADAVAGVVVELPPSDELVRFSAPDAQPRSRPRGGCCRRTPSDSRLGLNRFPLMSH